MKKETSILFLNGAVFVLAASLWLIVQDVIYPSIKNTEGILLIINILFVCLFVLMWMIVLLKICSIICIYGEMKTQTPCVDKSESDKEKDYIYSVLERHVDGYWWWHPWLNRQPYSTPQEAEERFQQVFPDKERPHVVFAHQKPFNLELSVCTLDFVNFDFAGHVYWSSASEDCEGTSRMQAKWILDKNKDTIILISTIKK